MVAAPRQRHHDTGTSTARTRDRLILAEVVGYYGLLGAVAVGTLFLR